ncbi:MAG: hypothetical protein NTY12_05325 [Candidatus Falkowbacteria bacterium]|nr:hypothetical protein [Candidatus Falkowbacteria bacterium]
MIDSITIILQDDQYKLEEKNKLYGKKEIGGKGYGVSSQNCGEYLKLQHKKRRYFPSITLSNKKAGLGEIKESLEIQISLPKAIYGTNLAEIDDAQLDKIYRLLKGYLEEVGITTTIDEIKKAIIRRADFSKVIALPSYLGQANQVIHILSRFNYKQQSDFTLKEFYDGCEGIAMKFWNNTQGYCIYDKFSEIINNGYTENEKKIIASVKQNQTLRCAIKFELSLQRKTSLEAVVWRRLKNGKKKDFTLEEILNKDLAKGILLDSFNKVFDDVSTGLVSLSEMGENELLTYLDRSKITQCQQDKLFRWVRMATIFGVKGTWEKIKTNYNGGSVNRLKKEVSLILTELGEIDSKLPNLIAFLREQHEKFEIIKTD